MGATSYFAVYERSPFYRVARTARDGFESITDTEVACKYRQELTSTGDVITTVSQNSGALGYASVASVKDSVNAQPRWKDPTRLVS